MPVGLLLGSRGGNQPNTAAMAGSAVLLIQGSSSSSAQAPKTMVGTPAATSITTPMTPAIEPGAYSVKRMAMPMEMGTAMSRASPVVMSVPTINGAAP